MGALSSYIEATQVFGYGRPHHFQIRSAPDTIVKFSALHFYLYAFHCS